MMHDLVDMDTHEKIRYISESSNASTSGYSTMSPSGSMQHSMPPSPAQSPGTVLQTEFSNLNLPPNSPQMQQQQQHYSTSYGNYVNYNHATVGMQQSPYGLPQQQQYSMSTGFHNNLQQPQPKSEYTAELRIIEQPVEKFRFRYKSEMHGTHGSLNGANSKRTPKTYPEVELVNFNAPAIIRCSLFQTNLDSPHSHQLVVRKDDHDICDPHDVQVSPESGFVAQFQNMGIIHTAKKFIFDELLKKKKNRLQFDLGCDQLTTKQIQELHKATEKEAKDMNLNQVRLCFEAFKVEQNNVWTRIAAPVYTNPINNRKSAQTGELRIVRLSVATGSVKGGDDLILLVEKVSKKNIKVRFYELSEDEGLVWEAFGRFRESDVHHQYAIVCQTPAYKDKEIDKPVDIYIELVRPSDDERSYPAVPFRYKPLDQVVSRKRRRTCSTATSSSGSGSSVNSFEVPKTIQDQQQQQHQMSTSPINHILDNVGMTHNLTISEEFNKDDLIESAAVDKIICENSAELIKLCIPMLEFPSFEHLPNEMSGCLQTDGGASAHEKPTTLELAKLNALNKMLATTLANEKVPNDSKLNDLQRIFKLFDEARNNVKKLAPAELNRLAQQMSKIFLTHAERNVNGDSLIHEIIVADNVKVGLKTCHIINFFHQHELLNRVLNANNESGLHYACLYDRALYVRPLLGLGCDPNIQNRHGNTALHIAVREQHIKCVESFLNMQAINLDLTLRNDDGLTPLHLAVAQKSNEIAKKLLQYSPAAALVPNSKEGNNFLHMAVRQQKLALIEMLLQDKSQVDRHALLTARNTAGHTALEMAKLLNTKVGNEIAQLLAKHSTTTNPPVDDDDEIGQEPGNLVIKEEEMSSSAEDEDDNDDEEHSEIVDDETRIKVEHDVEHTFKRLSEVLCDARKFKKITYLLNEQSKWRHLAEKCKLHKFLCLWTNAEDFLQYVRNEQHVKYETFVAALAEIDRDALDVFLTRME